MKTLTTKQLTAENDLRKAENLLLLERIIKLEKIITPPPPVKDDDSEDKIPINANQFDIEFLTRRFKNAPVYSTNDFSGSDLGMRINQADAKLGNRIGIIKIEYQPGLEFLTPALPQFENRWFIFCDGKFKSRTGFYGVNNSQFSYGRVLFPRSNSLISGTSHDAIVVEAQSEKNQPPKHSLFAPFNSTVVPYDLGESTANILKSENIHYFNFQINGLRTNRPNDIGLATITIANDDNCSVQDMLIKDGSGYNVQGGATCGQKVVGLTLPNGRQLGYHARNCAILRNVFENALTQNLGLINFDGLLVENNLMKNPTRPPLDGDPFNPISTGGDVEPIGDPREIVRGLRMRNNVIDCTDSKGSLYFVGIAFQVNEETYNDDNEITDNIISDNTTNKTQMSIGITVNGRGTQNLLLARNKINECGQAGLDVTGNNITLIDNEVKNSGGGGNPAMFVNNLTNSKIIGTKILRDVDRFDKRLEIWETGENKGNVWENNDAEEIRHSANAKVSDSVYRNNKGLVIENSNSKNNRIS